jgi:F-type H+-transporting ATPase subunit gamma
MASLKEIKTRIGSVQSTRKITSAMKLVSSAKLHKAEASIKNMLPYQQQLDKMLRNFLSGDVSVESPYTEVREVKRVAIVLFASNSSLCGAFNSNVAKAFSSVLREYQSLGPENILVYVAGKKLEDAVVKAGLSKTGVYQSLVGKPTYAEAAGLAQLLMKLFAQKQVDRVEVIYHHFKSAGVQRLTRQCFLPIDLSALTAGEAGNGAAGSGSNAGSSTAAGGSSAGSGEQKLEGGMVNNYIVEPSPAELINALLPQTLCQSMFTAAMDSVASEHAARLMAMQAATDNAENLIQELTLQYNKGRQQAITNELLDIIGGSIK